MMIRTISSRILYAFAMKNKTQNFFDMNPVYPYMGEKGFDIYNSQRKKINVIDEYGKLEQRQQRFQNLVKEKIYLKKYERFIRYSQRRTLVYDKDTNLPTGMDSDFDDFVKLFRRQIFLDKTAKHQFKQTFLKIIRKFKCKSQVELIKIFRISLAHLRKNSLIDKVRGNIMQQAVIKAAELMKNFDVVKSQKSYQDEQEVAFSKSLKQIDDKIFKIQEQLKYDQKGLPRMLSKYHPKYGWEETRKAKENQNYDLNIKVGSPYLQEVQSAYQKKRSPQDESIRQRINRLYFLRRLQFLNKKQRQFNDQQFQKQLPLSLGNRDKIINQIAFKYKQLDLLQIPDIDQIYKDIDAAIDKVNIKMSSGKIGVSGKSAVQQVYDRHPEQNEYLWENISAQEILCDSLYNEDSIKSLVINDQVANQVSPSAHTQITLNRLPINLYRHTELDQIGIFNQYRKKLGQKVLDELQTEYQPQFNDFTLQKAKLQKRRIQKKAVQRKTTSFGKARRKSARAQCTIKSGTGVVLINNRPIQDHFGNTYHRVEALKPLIITQSAHQYDVYFKAAGSGLKGQSQCMGYALARALMKINPDHKRVLEPFGFAGYDFRKKQPKKTNLYSARVRPPYVRR